MAMTPTLHFVIELPIRNLRRNLRVGIPVIVMGDSEFIVMVYSGT